MNLHLVVAALGVAVLILCGTVAYLIAAVAALADRVGHHDQELTKEIREITTGKRF